MLEFKGKELRQLKKWIAALDSGKYAQCNGHLNINNAYCCLGVGVSVLVKRIDLILIDDGVRENNRILGAFPNAQLKAPMWLKEINGDFERKTGHRLSVLNDDLGFTFPEIATLLELVYIHKIFDDEFL